MSRPADPRAIADPELVQLLASPVRQELVDMLAALGGMASVATLAEQLGRPADGLYHHMRLLAAAGLVDATEPDTGGERRYRLVGDGSPIRLAYRQGPDGNTHALRQFARALLHVAASDFDEAVDRPGVALSGPQRQLWASRTTGWVSDGDLVEINRLLERLGAILSQPRSDDRSRLMCLAFALAPLHPRPKRRS